MPFETETTEALVVSLRRVIGDVRVVGSPPGYQEFARRRVRRRRLRVAAGGLALAMAGGTGFVAHGLVSGGQDQQEAADSRELLGPDINPCAKLGTGLSVFPGGDVPGFATAEEAAASVGVDGTPRVYSDKGTTEVVYFNPSGTPVTSVEVQQLGESWYVGGVFECQAHTGSR